MSWKEQLHPKDKEDNLDIWGRRKGNMTHANYISPKAARRGEVCPHCGKKLNIQGK